MSDVEASWKSRVGHQFSDAGAAQRWSRIYGGAAAEVEDHFFLQRRDFIVDYVLKHCPEQALIMDLGCGAAPVTAPLRAAGRTVLPLDYSPDMLSLARKRLIDSAIDPFPLIQADSEFLPFANAKFDFVICLGVISYLPDYSRVLAEIIRVLRPGGRTVISTRNRRNPLMSDPLLMAKRLLRVLLPDPAEEFFPGRFLDPAEVEANLVATGFEVEAFTGIGYGPIRFRGRQVVGTDASVRLSRLVSSVAERTDSNWLRRNFSDVNIWTCGKPSEEAQGAE